MAFYHWETYNEFTVPWDKEQGIIGYGAIKDKVHLATPAVTDNQPRYKSDVQNSGLVGYPIHTCCWEILCNHQVGATAENGMERLLLVLRQKYGKWKYRVNVKEPERKLMAADGITYPDSPLLVEYLAENGTDMVDPGNIKLIQSVIKRARCRTAAWFKTKSRHDCCSYLLYSPIELLLGTLDHLPLPDVKSVQSSMWIYLGVTYWRFRIPMGFFHEVNAVMEQTLDWEFLCFELDCLVRTSEFNGLACRRYLFKRLDEVQDALNKTKAQYRE